MTGRVGGTELGREGGREGEAWATAAIPVWVVPASLRAARQAHQLAWGKTSWWRAIHRAQPGTTSGPGEPRGRLT
ncbi:hypothetical protein E2C01_094655 [Portunus trituberculatus]|uniref:Uncharacterized protein n=1 Tax=Portunus trituberculatus TaxID=210409 RepID=A0A5B7JXS7_PORTR|nr:hypothetical protein [Portunus trituberculatus]